MKYNNIKFNIKLREHGSYFILSNANHQLFVTIKLCLWMFKYNNDNDKYGVFCPPRFECGCRGTPVFRVCDARQKLYLFSLFLNPDLDDCIYCKHWKHWKHLLPQFVSTIKYNTMLFVYRMYTKSIFISKRLYIKTRGPNCKL